MAEVVVKKRPGTCDPTGTGMMVVDCLAPFPAEVTDPLLLLHAFGPSQIRDMPKFGMHPHRGFNEVPYLKQGRWLATDPWNMEAEGEDAKFDEGQLQWGKAASGIEHGMKFDPTYDGPVRGFQLWINLRAADKMSPPSFQNARADALPVVSLGPGAEAKLLVGEMFGARSPVDSQGVPCVYLDVMLEPGASCEIPRSAHAADLSSCFVYVYEGSGTFGANGVEASEGETMRLAGGGDVSIRAGAGGGGGGGASGEGGVKLGLGALVIAGEPIKEPIVQHGPFVMSSREQVMEAFRDYQSGRFIAEECTYALHTAQGTAVSTRPVDPTYRKDR